MARRTRIPGLVSQLIYFEPTNLNAVCHSHSRVAGPVDGRSIQEVSFINRLTASAYSTVQIFNINSFTRELKFYGLWAKLDCFYIFAAYNAADAYLNWISSSFNCISIGGTPPVFTSFRGVMGDGTQACLNTQYSPNSNKTALSLNSASIGGYARSERPNFGSERIEMGAATGTDPGLDGWGTNFYNPSNQLSLYMNSAYGNWGAQLVPPTAAGLYTLSRTSSTQVDVYINGNLGASTSSSNSTSIINLPIYILNSNFAGGQDTCWINYELAAAFVGGGMTAAESSLFYTLLQKYLGTVGAAV